MSLFVLKPSIVLWMPTIRSLDFSKWTFMESKTDKRSM